MSSYKNCCVNQWRWSLDHRHSPIKSLVQILWHLPVVPLGKALQHCSLREDWKLLVPWLLATSCLLKVIQIKSNQNKSEQEHFHRKYMCMLLPHWQNGPSTEFRFLISFFCPTIKACTSVASRQTHNSCHTKSLYIRRQKKEIRSRHSVLGPFCRWGDELC